MSTHHDERYHNQPESGALSSHEQATLEAGRAAWASLRKTFEQWTAIGKAIKVLRDKADRDGRRQTFKILMRQQGFSMEGRPEDGRVLQKARVTRLLHIMEHLAEVQTWHAGLSPFQQVEWSSPDAVYRHCPVFAKSEAEDEGEKPPSAFAKVKEENRRLQEEVARLAADDVGDVVINRADTAPDIADTLVRGLPEAKIRNLIAALQKALKARAGEFEEASAALSDDPLQHLQAEVQIRLKREDWNRTDNVPAQVAIGDLLRQAQAHIRKGAGPRPDSAGKKKTWEKRVERQWRNWLDACSKLPGGGRVLLTDQRVQFLMKAKQA